MKGTNFGLKCYTEVFTVVYKFECTCMSMHYKKVWIPQYFNNGERQNPILCQ